jgi:hypothetical protein
MRRQCDFQGSEYSWCGEYSRHHFRRIVLSEAIAWPLTICRCSSCPHPDAQEYSEISESEIVVLEIMES